MEPSRRIENRVRQKQEKSIHTRASAPCLTVPWDSGGALRNQRHPGDAKLDGLEALLNSAW
jgi:hypothetical protein